MFLVLSIPLGASEFVFPPYESAASAESGWRVLFLNGYPAHVLPSERLQKQLRPLGRALCEQVPRKWTENEQVFTLGDSRERHVGRNGARATATN